MVYISITQLQCVHVSLHWHYGVWLIFSQLIMMLRCFIRWQDTWNQMEKHTWATHFGKKLMINEKLNKYLNIEWFHIFTTKENFMIIKKNILKSFNYIRGGSRVAFYPHWCANVNVHSTDFWYLTNISSPGHMSWVFFCYLFYKLVFLHIIFSILSTFVFRTSTALMLKVSQPSNVTKFD